MVSYAANFDTIIDEDMREVLTQEVERGDNYLALELETPLLALERFKRIVRDYSHLFSSKVDKNLFVLYMTSDITLDQLADIEEVPGQSHAQDGSALPIYYLEAVG